MTKLALAIGCAALLSACTGSGQPGPAPSGVSPAPATSNAKISVSGSARFGYVKRG